MPHYLNPNVVLHYDFIITYLTVIFFVSWIRTKFQLKRLNYVFFAGLGKQEHGDSSQKSVARAEGQQWIRTDEQYPKQKGGKTTKPNFE